MAKGQSNVGGVMQDASKGNASGSPVAKGTNRVGRSVESRAAESALSADHKQAIARYRLAIRGCKAACRALLAGKPDKAAKFGQGIQADVDAAGVYLL